MAGGAVRPAVGREGMGAGVALVLTRWRTWLAFAGFGSAVAFAYRGDWVWCAGAAALVCDTCLVTKLRAGVRGLSDSVQVQRKE